MGKPHTEHSVEEIVRVVAECRGVASYVARRLGVSRQAIEKRMKTSPLVAQAFADERARFVDTAELALLKKVDEGDTTAIIFTLKTLGKDRGYIETARQDYSVPDGSTVRRIVIEEVQYGNGHRTYSANTVEAGGGYPSVSIPPRTDADVGAD